MQKILYSPGCALIIHNEETSNKAFNFLKTVYNNIELHTICCKHNPNIKEETLIINTCAGCDKRFSKLHDIICAKSDTEVNDFTRLYDKVTTISIWEIMAESSSLKLPNYNGIKMSVQDACPVRLKPNVHRAIRTLLEKMNIEVVETKYNREKTICCGDTLYPSVDVEIVNKKMKERANSMPVEDVCVYCISCIKAMHIGRKKPRYMLDLVFNQETEIGVYDTVSWHKELDSFITLH